MRPLLNRLRSDRRGAALIEFAIVAPVMMFLLMGIFDLCYQIYIQSVLNGAAQKAGRDSGIQGGSQATSIIDQKVMSYVWKVAKDASIVKSDRKSYAQFGNIKPEDFIDSNKNGKYDKGECFFDVNANNGWDADPGITGQGGANEVTVYTLTIQYPRLFPVAGLFGWDPNQQLSATTILKNQPYQTQASTTVTKICK